MMKMNKYLINTVIFLVAVIFSVHCFAAVPGAKPFKPGQTDLKLKSKFKPELNNDKKVKGMPKAIVSGDEQEKNKTQSLQKDSNEAIEYEALTTSIDPNAFSNGYKLFKDKKYLKACPYFFNYLSNHSQDDADYEWAEFFFGISLKKSGFSHAAVDILSHLVTRKPNPKIVAYCLELFEEITRTMPFDKEKIILKALCDQEYGFVDRELKDFISFYQGVFDWENGFYQWGQDHFSSITEKTYYYYKYQYHRALYAVYQDNIDEAIEILQSILSEDHLKGQDKDSYNTSDLTDEVRKTLARLLYEKGEFRRAEILYEEIEKSILDEALSLLDRAWIQYRLGNAQEAMGLLFAFEAPSFQRFFTPEYYLLKSFIYKDVCHYQTAMTVVKEFNDRYHDALSTIYNRDNYTENKGLLLVILNKKKVKQSWDLLGLLDKEKEKTGKFQEKERALYKFLDKLYSLQIKKSASHLNEQVENEYAKMANELLKYEEEAYLMEYEIGLDMSKRVSQIHYSEDKPEKKKSKIKKVVYPFQGEFWNDELTDYKVTLTNKCQCIEEWDIFFK